MMDAQTWMALHALNAQYWLRVDRVSAEPVGDLYVEDGLMQIGQVRCVGRGEIRDFFVARAARETASQRTTRHASYQLVIDQDAPGRCRIRSTVQVMAGTGSLPLMSSVPATVADFDDVAVRDEHGDWRFESRTAQAVFLGEGAAPFARQS